MNTRPALRVLPGATIVVGLAWLVLSAPPRATGEAGPAAPPSAPQGAAMDMHHAGAGDMSEAAMKAQVDAWFARHPATGESSHQVQATTFTAQNFRFDSDGNALTQIDTAKISVGQTITWQWVNGSHTVTSGTGSADPQMGTLFNHALSLTSQTFSFTFNNPGTFPFFCAPHEFDNMKGVVVVSSTAGVPPGSSGPLGFTADPSPNPTRAGTGFAFALRTPGRCRLEVFDARGRRVAAPFDEDLPPGPHAGAWDGRTSAGTRAATGLYYLRLTLPGYTGSRALALTH